jgi:hypothetical protein
MNTSTNVSQFATCKLANAEERHSRYPQSFYLPALKARQSIKPGQFAKLIFEINDDCAAECRDVDERMWVQIVEQTPTGYVGTLRNAPGLFKELQFGDTIRFGFEHIIDIERAPRYA